MFWWVFLFLAFDHIVFSDAIINGRPNIGKNKYHVAIKHSDNHYDCNGAIINERFIISAAGCFTKENHRFIEGPITIIAGIVELTRVDDPMRVEVDVDKVYVPAHYGHRGKYEDDIAIARLKQSLELAKNDLKALVIPSDGSSQFVDAKAFVTGFGWKKVTVTVRRDGAISKTGEVDNYLLFADAKILSNDECKRREYESLRASQLCAKIFLDNEVYPHGTCDTDRGGPLVQMVNELNVLVGILVANTPVCSESYFPALYTRVSSFSSFIIKVLRDEQSERIKTKDYQRELQITF